MKPALRPFHRSSSEKQKRQKDNADHPKRHQKKSVRFKGMPIKRGKNKKHRKPDGNPEHLAIKKIVCNTLRTPDRFHRHKAKRNNGQKTTQEYPVKTAQKPSVHSEGLRRMSMRAGSILMKPGGQLKLISRFPSPSILSTNVLETAKILSSASYKRTEALIFLTSKREVLCN